MIEPGDALEASLEQIAHRFSSLSTPVSIDTLRRFVGEILRWNAELGLVSKKDPLAACRRLIIESAEFGDVVGRALVGVVGARIADVGSGAGFPGVVWRLQRADFELVLIERREKRAVFLERIVRSLKLDRVDVRAADARDVSRLAPYRGSFDVVATMAVGDPVRTAPQVEDLLVAGGLFATTLPEETVAPERCGHRLALEDDVRAEFGRYGLYRNRV
jgi:16S rRNA (guanine527-N7)-methyltransferase